jgi:hypothetical protein
MNRIAERRLGAFGIWLETGRDGAPIRGQFPRSFGQKLLINFDFLSAWMI